MSLKHIYKELGIEINYQDEMDKFCKRLEMFFRELDNGFYNSVGDYNNWLLMAILFKTGIGYDPSRYPVHSRLNTLIKITGRDISVITEDALRDNLFILQILLTIFDEKKTNFTRHTAMIQEIFNLCEVDIGYVFKDGQIIRSGAKELDKTIILENLQWLRNYPAARELFSNALTYYFTKKFEDAVTNAHSALESLVKTFLNRNKSLDNEEIRKELVSNLNLDSSWGQILFHFSKIAHEFSSRHGKKQQNSDKIDESLVEFYIYITGVFIRLISRRINSAQP